METTLFWIEILIVLLAITTTLVIAYTIFLRIKFKISMKKSTIENERKSFRNLLSGKEEVLSKMSRELHDDVGARLFGIKMILKNEEDAIFTNSPPELKTWIRTLNKEIETLSFEVRNLSHEYAPYIQDLNSLRNSLTSFIHRINSRNEINCTLVIEDSQLNYLDKSIALETYRIITELLKNIISHAKASNAVVAVTSKSAIIQIEVEDNGIGLPQASTAAGDTVGIGLRNIQTRVSLSGGNINFTEGVNGSGTKVVIEMPKYL